MPRDTREIFKVVNDRGAGMNTRAILISFISVATALSSLL
jgi:hypothetical protein